MHKADPDKAAECGLLSIPATKCCPYRQAVYSMQLHLLVQGLQPTHWLSMPNSSLQSCLPCLTIAKGYFSGSLYPCNLGMAMWPSFLQWNVNWRVTCHSQSYPQKPPMPAPWYSFLLAVDQEGTIQGDVLKVVKQSSLWSLKDGGKESHPQSLYPPRTVQEKEIHLLLCH